MMGQQFIILLIVLVCITLAHSATTLKKKDKKPVKLIRQGLEKSAESAELEQQENLEEPINEPYAEPDELEEPGEPEEPAEHAPEYAVENGGEQNHEPFVNNDNIQEQGHDEDYGDHISHINQMEQQYDGDDEDGFFLDMESGEYDSKETLMLHGKGTRALEAGDIFTAQEMLPIAVKLMNRAKSKGKGKGIVTCESNPKSLADSLFEKYFWKNCEIHLLNGETVVSHASDWCNLVETTDENEVFKMKRIVILKAEDISGLDALQALALSGTVSTERSRDKYIEPETNLEQSPAEYPDSTVVTSRRKSLYRLLTKPFYNKIRRVPSRREHLAFMKSKMGKKRKLIVNPKRRLARKLKSRRGQSKKAKLNKIGRQGQINGEKRKTINKVDGGSKTKRFCRWKYGCEHPQVLETCRLSMDCSEEARSKNYLGIQLLPFEKRENLDMLRSMAGIDVMDTEVEKILENRFNQLIYSKLGNIQRSESVADYFNNLIHFQNRENQHRDGGHEGITTPMDSYEDSTDSNVQQNSGEQDSDAKTPGLSNEGGQQDADAEANGVSDEGGQKDPDPDAEAENPGSSAEAPESDVVQLQAEVKLAAEGQEVADVEAETEPGQITEEAAPETDVVQLHAKMDTSESKEHVEEGPGPGNGEIAAEEGTTEPGQIVDEIAAAKLAGTDIESRRRYLSDHRSPLQKLKPI